MSDPRADHPSRMNICACGDDKEQLRQSSRTRTGSSSTPSAAGDQGDDSAAGLSASTRPMANAAHQHADVQPLAEQMTPKPTPSARFSSPLDVLAKVELQLMLQFLDTESRLMAARCSRHLLQAADHPFAWRGAPARVNSHGQPQLGSLIRRSLLRHAPIALRLVSDLPVAEIAAIAHLRELTIPYGVPGAFIERVLALPSLQRLQLLKVLSTLPDLALRLLPTLPALHTLQLQQHEFTDWRWLAMPALTDLYLTCLFQDFPPPLVDAIGQCARLQTLQLEYPSFQAGDFARLCSTPAMRRLRRLRLDSLNIYDGDALMIAPEYGEGFGALARLESLRLAAVKGVNRLLPHLAHAPALRTLSVVCQPCHPNNDVAHKTPLPGREALRQLLAAAPLLEVRLEMAAAIDKWRNLHAYHAHAHSASYRVGMDGQWRDLQRSAEQVERVTIVDA